ncbi:helix-turn-helix domain-containing protein [Antrihabitans cavernicola]|uniref:Helix-turn-helix domain-containing protein n=1 Tax=Antrihabitans cavernicola TaxID=2495913 RepID=A0A5A7SB83_9NOCA|nr:helix-turn-helix domain-containing protein [Spelaeibacter cavernicola]
MSRARFELVSVKEAAAEAGLHANTIYTALQSGELRGFQRKARASWRIDVRDLAAWLRGEQVSA